MYARNLSALAFATDGKASLKIKHRKILKAHVFLEGGRKTWDGF